MKDSIEARLEKQLSQAHEDRHQSAKHYEFKGAFKAEVMNAALVGYKMGQADAAAAANAPAEEQPAQPADPSVPGSASDPNAPAPKKRGGRRKKADQAPEVSNGNAN